MKFSPAFLLASGAAASAVLGKPLVAGDGSDLFHNPTEYHHQRRHHQRRHHHEAKTVAFPGRIPTSYESAILARRILNKTPYGTISTVFQRDSTANRAHSWETRPEGLAGVPVGLPEYLADCEEDDTSNAGNPTLLAIGIATAFKNARAGSNVSITLQWTPPNEPKPARVGAVEGVQKLSEWEEKAAASDEPAHALAYSMASLPRFALLGYLESIAGQDAPTSRLARCFVRAHPDTKRWLPGNAIHESEWVRLVVTEVYWVGGFGDRAYIGWIPVKEWQAVTRAEWEKVRLPGEHKGWKAWTPKAEL